MNSTPPKLTFPGPLAGQPFHQALGRSVRDLPPGHAETEGAPPPTPAELRGRRSARLLARAGVAVLLTAAVLGLAAGVVLGNARLGLVDPRVLQAVVPVLGSLFVTLALLALDGRQRASDALVASRMLERVRQTHGGLLDAVRAGNEELLGGPFPAPGK
jgi:hypothetical protein